MKPKLGVRAACVALFVVTGLMLSIGIAAADDDLAKVLVGTWQGELQQLVKKGADLTLRLVITSVKQEDGKWIADGRFGPTPVKIDIDSTGAKPFLHWTAANGTVYNLSLLDDKNLVGKAKLTTSVAPKGDRDRSVKLEKKD
jgi:hypothetical protein